MPKKTTQLCRRKRLPALATIAACAMAMSLTIGHSAHAQRTTEYTAIVDAPIESVWNAFTTKNGIEAWMAPKVDIDLRIGGLVRSSYDPNSTLEDDATITARIISYEPLRMWSSQNVGAPAGFPHAEALASTWSVTYFDPLGPDRTSVRILTLGWGDDEKADAAIAYFEGGNALLLNKLQETLAPDASATTENTPPTMDVLQRMVGGEWIHESTMPDGMPFRVRNALHSGPSPNAMFGDGWLGSAHGMFHHAHTTYRTDPRTGQVRFNSTDQDGIAAYGVITATDADSLTWDWRHDTEATPNRWHITTTFLGDDTYEMTMREHADDGTLGPAQTSQFTRTYDTPKEFLTMIGDTPATAIMDDAIEVSGVIEAPVADVWRAWTTNQGVREILGAQTNIDLRVGGPYEFYFDPSAPEGSRGSETCTILSYRPQEMLSFTWSAPPQFAHVRNHYTWVVIDFEPIDGGRTKLRLTHHGWAKKKAAHPRHGDEWDQVRAYFESAWPGVIAAMQGHFADR